MDATVTGKQQNGSLTIILAGHIDSANAAKVEDEIAALRSGNAADKLILDAQELKYISSAGLRVVLRLRKLCPELRIVNVCPEVYEIFDMTGFTEMIKIEKAYRCLSVDGCEVVGQGANGMVYRIDADTIIKVYRNPDSLPDIQRERELARKAFVLGVPTAIPYDVVRVGEGYGSVFELLNAKSFSKLIAAEPDKLEHYVELYVELLRKIHSTHVKPGDMPDMKAVAVDWAEFMRAHLPQKAGDRLVALMKAVPERDTMLHGDYHTKNVMMQNDEVLLIDMDTLCIGHPVFELASMYMAYIGFGIVDPSKIDIFLGIPNRTAAEIWKRSLQLYLGTDDALRLSQVEDKAKIVGYTRLIRRTIRRNGLETELGRKEIEVLTGELIAMLDKTDTLDF